MKDKHPPSRCRDSDRSKNHRKREPETKSQRTCKFCGKCTKCGGWNHFETQCTTPPKKINSLIDESPDDSNVEYLTSIVIRPEPVHTITQATYPKEIYTEMVVNQRHVKFQVNSSTSVNVRFVADNNLQRTTKTLQMWNEATLNPLGSCRIILQNPKNKKKFSVEFLVVDEQLTPLIGAKAAQKMGLIAVNTQNFKITKPPERPKAEVESVQTTEEIIAHYPEIFQRELEHFQGLCTLKWNKAQFLSSHHLVMFLHHSNPN